MPQIFNNVRPGNKNAFKTSGLGSSKFQPLPSPTGLSPFRLRLEDVAGNSLSKTKMVFHTAGDTGGIKNGDPQKIVIDKMEHQFIETVKKEDKPLFFYHLGDVVYFYGAESEYNNQFFEPYMFYPAPIFAIPGNHDGDIDPADPAPPISLSAFTKVFCDSPSHKLDIAGDAMRTSMIQPNVYWTLQTPLANIIGLYTNVPEHGVIKDDQKQWFLEELKNAQKERKDKAIIVSLHHPVYSVDKHHGSSGKMKDFLDKAFKKTKVYPDLILSGHVHNYQRFTRHYGHGQQLPFIVAGAGGYHNLHYVDSAEDPIYVPKDGIFDKVTMENFCDNRHGFLRITLEKTGSKRWLTGEYFTVPRPQEPWRGSAQLFDFFKLDLIKKTVSNNR